MQRTVKLPIQLDDAVMELMMIQHARMHALVVACIYQGVRAIRNNPKLLNEALDNVHVMRVNANFVPDLGPSP